MVGFLETKYVDPLRRFWIDDNLPSWTHLEGSLTFEVKRNCQIDRYNVHQINSNCSGKVIYLGDYLNIWGHCITDNLKKLWFIRTDIGKDYIKKGYRLICTLFNATRLSPNFIKLLEYLGIDAKLIDIVPYGTSFEEIIIPQDSLGESHKSYKEFEDTINIIRDQIPIDPTLPQKVYFSRSRLNNGRDFGEKNIEEVFAKLGYCIIYPEQLPLEKQLLLLKNCKEFAATEGSVSHVMMFCQDGVKCNIIRKTVSFNGYQFTINSIRKVIVCYIDAHLSLFQIFDNSFGPFFLYVNDNVVSFANDNGLKIEKKLPLMSFLRYLWQVLFFALRYRTKPKRIRDIPFYWHRLTTDWNC